MKNTKSVNKKTINSRNMKSKKAKNISKKNKGRKLSFISAVDYAFLISLAFSIIFGIQTNSAFMWPFTIMLLITIICMMIILINAIYVKIFKKIKKVNKHTKE